MTANTGKQPHPSLMGKVSKIVVGLLSLVKAPGIMVVEPMDAPHRYGVLSVALSHVVGHFATDGFSLMPVNLTTVKQAICGRSDAKLQDVMTVVAHQYPLFFSRLHEKKAHQRRYWQRVIMAMALAVAARISVQREAGKPASHRRRNMP